MGNENEDTGIISFHDSCGLNILVDNTGTDDGYHSQQSSDTPPSPIDETSPPFHQDIEDSNFEPGDELPCDQFYFEDENAIEDITKGIAFVLVHKNDEDKISSVNIRKIVQTGKEDIIVMMCSNDFIQ